MSAHQKPMPPPTTSSTTTTTKPTTTTTTATTSQAKPPLKDLLKEKDDRLKVVLFVSIECPMLAKAPGQACHAHLIQTVPS